MRPLTVDRRLLNYLRTHRKRSGLSLRDMASVLGYEHQAAISRHERFLDLPTLEIALGYEIIFRIPVAELFAGMRDEIEEEVERQLGDLERTLGQKSASNRNAMAVARKLLWLNERKQADYQSLP